MFIYHHRNLLLKGFLLTPLFSSTNQWEFKGHQPVGRQEYLLQLNGLAEPARVHPMELKLYPRYVQHLGMALVALEASLDGLMAWWVVWLVGWLFGHCSLI
jgi:hypothetical protein